ncbi:hypothetical protein HY948_00215 [Candidatus Gottesmanbacteria bacterium]|nr:hypothetical protein [Candidatus Gottesmanbacteria bacterium]
MSLFAVLVLFGMLVRFFMIMVLPIWADEHIAYTIVSRPFIDIMLRSTDAARPPMYYIFLKAWSSVSLALPWLRFSSFIFFGINCYVLWKIGSALHDRFFGKMLVAVYALSGYFVIFDWRVKPYTALLTAMLLTIFLLQRKSVHFLFLFGTLLSGLLLDFGYLYFYIPMTFYYMVLRHKNRVTAVVISAGLLFGLYILGIPRDYPRFIAGTAWVRSYMHPAFTLPYLSGFAGIPFVAFPVVVIWVAGYYLHFMENGYRTLGGMIWHGAVASYIVAAIVSWAWIPILHVRSLQIVALSMLFSMAYALYFCRTFALWEKRLVYVVAFGLMALNAARVAYQMTYLPGIFLVSFMQ